VLLLVVRTSGTSVRAVRGDLGLLPRCVVGLAVPRKTRGGRLVRVLRGAQYVTRRSKRAPLLGAASHAQSADPGRLPALSLAEEPTGTI
jgi:hypothetical protein